MSGCPPGLSWWSSPQYQQYWEDRRKVEEQLQCQGSPAYPQHGHLGEERRKGGRKREAAYWKAVAIGLQFENCQLQSMIKSLLGLESNQYPGSMTASLQVGQNHQQGSSWSDMNCREDESSSSEEESSSDSEESYLQEKQTSGGRIKDNFVKSSSSGTVKEEVDTLEEEYFRFLEVTEKHRQNRDEGQSLKKKFDIRTDTITDEILEEGLAMIGTDHEKTKREMEQLYGSKAMKVHSEETKAQLRFDNWRDQNNAIMWPALPLKIIR